MPPDKPMLGKMGIEEENARLNLLYWDCETFLQKWNVYDSHQADEKADAFVAILALQSNVIARRAYILGLLHQQEFPF